MYSMCLYHLFVRAKEYAIYSEVSKMKLRITVIVLSAVLLLPMLGDAQGQRRSRENNDRRRKIAATGEFAYNSRHGVIKF